ncbi:hypothetical protein GME_04187 [Halomonas sp. TD01]|nr:hypothetical protein GME_04187 [Halomonas sp. TD01]
MQGIGFEGDLQVEVGGAETVQVAAAVGVPKFDVIES